MVKERDKSTRCKRAQAADQVYVKWVDVNGTKVIDDIVIVECKLKSGTQLTVNQTAGKNATSFIVRNSRKIPESSVTGNILTNSLPPITTNNKWMKIYDSDLGNSITGIDKI